MIVQYIAAALASARLEEIEDEEPWYGEIPGLRGVWATGRTEDECRARLAEALDGWLLVRLRRGLSIPSIGGVRLEPAEAMPADAGG
jgi:predicted RNase H-like HicB family nuclease